MRLIECVKQVIGSILGLCRKITSQNLLLIQRFRGNITAIFLNPIALSNAITR